MKKRILSFLMALGLVVSSLPIPAYAQETPVYYCGAEEHAHSIEEGCYTQTCESPVHTHGEDCALTLLDCPLTEEPHEHGEACPADCALTVQPHGHTEQCSHKCAVDAHIHTLDGGCYTLNCGTEVHAHEDTCQVDPDAQTQRTCECPEVEGAVVHAADCQLFTCNCPEADGVVTHQEDCAKFVPVSHYDEVFALFAALPRAEEITEGITQDAYDAAWAKYNAASEARSLLTDHELEVLEETEEFCNAQLLWMALSNVTPVPLADHSHDGGKTFTAWTPGSTLTAGSYYLSDSVATDGFSVSGDVTLCLNGKSLDLGAGRITVETDGKLTICDCGENAGSGQITSSALGDCPATIENKGVLTVQGGTITGTDYGIYNSSANASAVICGGKVSGNHQGICNYGAGSSATIIDGEVSGRTCGIGDSGSGTTVTVSGGKVTGGLAGISSSSSIYVKGGAISSSSGWGIDNSGTLTVEGGEISGPTAIFNASVGTAIISAGTISGLRRIIDNKGVLKLTGAPVFVKKNLEDIYLFAGGSIDADGYTGAQLTVQVDPAVADGAIIVSNSTESRFAAANEDHLLQQSGDDLRLHRHSWADTWSSDANGHWRVCEAESCGGTKGSYAAHTAHADDGNCMTPVDCAICGYELTAAQSAHQYTYSASGAVITESCGNCTAHSATATIAAPTGDLTYDGAGKTAAVDYSDTWQGGTLTPEYSPGNSNAGDVTASITKEGATASVDYTILAATLPVPTGLAWSEGRATWLAVSNAAGGYLVQLYKNGEAEGTPISVTNGTSYTFGLDAPGSYTFTVKAFSSGNNYADSDVSAPSAAWEIRGYTVTWVDDDGRELEKDTNVMEGTTPRYDGAEPTKTASGCVYTFQGWSPAVSPVTGDTTYTAVFTAVYVKPESTEGFAFNYAAGTITVQPGYEVNTARDFTGTAIANGTSLDGYFGQTLYIRKAATTDPAVGASEPGEIRIPTRRAEPGTAVTAVAETLQGRNDGKLTGLTDEMEYSTDGGRTWTACTTELLTVANNGADKTVLVRYAAPDASSFAGAASTYTLPASRATLTVSFEANGGTGTMADSSFGYEGGNLPANTFTRAHYRFAGWNTNAGGTGTAYADEAAYTPGTGNITLYAQWTAVPYSITYVLDGGVNPTGTVSSYTVESAAIPLPTPTKTCCVFEGWYLESTFQTRVTEIPADATGNLVFYAKWSYVAYQITQGGGQFVVKGNSALFISNAPYTKYVKVQVDGADVPPADVTVQEGSTKVTLSASYIHSLSNSTHTLRILSSDGWADTTFTVLPPPADADSPRTGDTTNNGLWLTVAGIGLVGFLAALIGKRYYRKRK